MRSSLGLVVLLASLSACAAATEPETATDKTESSLYVVKDPSWYPVLKPYVPPPIVFQSISGYAGFPTTSGHSNGPYQSTFARPSYVSTNASGTTWVVDEDTNDPNLGYVRMISDTRGGVVGPHVWTISSLYDIGFGPWNLGGMVALSSGTEAYFSDVWYHAIIKVTIGQPRQQIAGGYTSYPYYYAGGFADGNGTNARFNSPRGMTRDASDNVYIADFGNHAVRKMTPQGDVSTVAASASFSPEHLAIAPDGRTIYAISGQAVYRVTQSSVVLVAGAPSTAGFANGAGASALFHDPKGIAVDPSGDIYVADSGNHCIRKITASTLTVANIGSLPPFNATRGMWDTYGPDESQVDAPYGLSFWNDRLVFTDTGRLTVRTMNPTAPQP